MFGSIGRLKAAVEVVGRETVRVMKKNQLKKKKDFGDKGNVRAGR